MKNKKKKFDKVKEQVKENKEIIPPSPTGKIGNIVMSMGLFLLFSGYFTLYKGSDTLAPILIVSGIITFAISLLLEPSWLPRG